MGDTKEDLQTTIPFPAVMVKHAPEMTAAPVADVLVHPSHAFHVNIVIMTHVVWNQDIAWLEILASPVEIEDGIIHARSGRSLPNTKITYRRIPIITGPPKITATRK